MDEILATIRRIIAEDEQSSGATARGVPAPVSNERVAGLGETAPAPAEEADANSVLDLTDALNEDGSVRRLVPLGTAPGVPEPEPAPPTSPPDPARAPLFAEKAAETMEVEAKPADASAKTERTVDPGPVAPSSGATDERLLSEVAALAAATAFGRLASVPRVRREPPRVGDRPLDEIVRELLRPLLRTWLDENLPGIVERLVQEEIARISTRSVPG
ncbi:MAG: DUF2497 domain-containing protein [Alphaproteobacteria bacterium]